MDYTIANEEEQNTVSETVEDLRQAWLVSS
jgi:hypothetical protein